jgi:hypothetical protein
MSQSLSQEPGVPCGAGGPGIEHVDQTSRARLLRQLSGFAGNATLAHAQRDNHFPYLAIVACWLLAMQVVSAGRSADLILWNEIYVPVGPTCMLRKRFARCMLEMPRSRCKRKVVQKKERA